MPRRRCSPTVVGLRGPHTPQKSLAQVEHAFRALKSVDLAVRPIHHRLAGRVRAHVFLCMLAYHVTWHMRRALAPLLFEDHDRAGAAAARPSPVAAAKGLARRRGQDNKQAHRRRPARAQLARPVAGPRHPDPQHRPPRRRAAHHHADPPHAPPPGHLRPIGHHLVGRADTRMHRFTRQVSYLRPREYGSSD